MQNQMPHFIALLNGQGLDVGAFAARNAHSFPHLQDCLDAREVGLSERSIKVRHKRAERPCMRSGSSSGESVRFKVAAGDKMHGASSKAPISAPALSGWKGPGQRYRCSSNGDSSAARSRQSP